jgi:hypothetical protein
MIFALAVGAGLFGGCQDVPRISSIKRMHTPFLRNAPRTAGRSPPRCRRAKRDVSPDGLRLATRLASYLLVGSFDPTTERLRQRLQRALHQRRSVGEFHSEETSEFDHTTATRQAPAPTIGVLTALTTAIPNQNRIQ